MAIASKAQMTHFPHALSSLVDLFPARLLPSGAGSFDPPLWGELEGKQVDPDNPAARGGTSSAGRDPILEAGVREVLGRLGSVPGGRRP